MLQYSIHLLKICEIVAVVCGIVAMSIATSKDYENGCR